MQFLIRIVQQSGLLNHFVPGDMIMADKGFPIQDILPNGVSLNIPPFLNNVYLQKVRQKPQNFNELSLLSTVTAFKFSWEIKHKA